MKKKPTTQAPKQVIASHKTQPAMCELSTSIDEPSLAKNLMNISRNIFLVSLLSSLLFTACAPSDETKPPNSASKSTSADSTRTATTITEPKDIPRENFGDKTIFSTPRIQFTAVFPGTKKTAIWSMRLDGTDVRLAAELDLIYGGGAEKLFNRPVRSPDNRYVAVVLESDEKGFSRYLLDLKGKKRIKIRDGGGKPTFIWTSDSQSVIFHTDQNMYRYYLNTGQLEELSDNISTLDFFLLADDRTLLALQGSGYKLYDIVSGKEKGNYSLVDDGADMNLPLVSPDGSTLLYKTWKNSNWHLEWVDTLSGKILGHKKAEEVCSNSRVHFTDKPSTLWCLRGYREEGVVGRNYKYYSLVELKQIGSIKTPNEIPWILENSSRFTLINYIRSEYYNKSKN